MYYVYKLGVKLFVRSVLENIMLKTLVSPKIQLHAQEKGLFKLLRCFLFLLYQMTYKIVINDNICMTKIRLEYI